MATNSIIFLDVDGVLTMSRCLLEDFVEGDESLYFHEGGEYIVPLEKSCVSNLKWIVDEVPNCYIVLSSTWREQPSYKKFLLSSLQLSGIAVENVYLGDTTVLGSVRGGRGAEVKDWLDCKCNLTYSSNCKFLIIDDDHKDSFCKYNLLANLVVTIMKDPDGNRNKEGLTRDIAERVIHYFNTDTPIPVPL